MGNKISSEDNFTYLFVALIFLLFSISAVEQFAGGAGQRLVSAATVVSLVVSVWSVRERKTWFRAGLGYALLLLGVVVIGIYLKTKYSRFHHSITPGNGFFITGCFLVHVRCFLLDITKGCFYNEVAAGTDT